MNHTDHVDKVEQNESVAVYHRIMLVSFAWICLTMFIDTAMTAYGVALDAGAEINPLIVFVWNSIPWTAWYEFVILVFLMKAAGLIIIWAIVIGIARHDPDFGMRLSVGAAIFQTGLVGFVVAANLCWIYQII